MDEYSTEESKGDSRPSPQDFDSYLPWACKQLQVEHAVQVIKVYQDEYISVALTDRGKKERNRGRSQIDHNIDNEKEEKGAPETTIPQKYEQQNAKIVIVQAVYDFCDNLVQLKFEENIYLPRVMFKILGLILQFHSHLGTITINRGLDNYTVYEICKFLPTHHITDICLDGCYLKGCNCYLLLESVSFLKNLSLCRCKIDDTTVETICSKLRYPLPAAKTLSILNLSTNRITDEGAKFLADALRSNRQLSYLNLANNMITDKGAALIFDTFLEFPLTTEEVMASKDRNMTYLHNKNDMVTRAIRDLMLGDGDKKSYKQKSLRPPTTGLRKVKRDNSQKSFDDPFRYLSDVNSGLVKKVISIIEKALGDFVDPFSVTNTSTRYGLTYCKGNNSLCCLNLSYNCLSYLSLRKILSILEHQRLADRKPRGLLTVSVEGNSMPTICKELLEIDNILEINLAALAHKKSKKRTQSKINPRS